MSLQVCQSLGGDSFIQIRFNLYNMISYMIYDISYMMIYVLCFIICLWYDMICLILIYDDHDDISYMMMIYDVWYMIYDDTSYMMMIYTVEHV